MTTARASEWDREYMRRIGRYKAESHADQLARHLALSPRERFVHALTMMVAGPLFDRPPLEPDDPSPLYEKARRLGLIKTGL
jgi:hypothetical protein